ncbi:MAG: hypothetical protein K2J62_03575 [Bacteroidales bacterium]|nr:hypothetical protein [Bacteroidales bacterium]
MKTGLIKTTLLHAVSAAMILMSLHQVDAVAGGRKRLAGKSSSQRITCAECTHEVTLSNGNISVTVLDDGALKSLKNVRTGQEYASGGYLWRMYYDSPVQNEIEISADTQKPQVSMSNDTVFICYPSIIDRDRELSLSLTLRIILEEDKVRFASSIENMEEHTVVREFQYPLVRNLNLPADHQLITSQVGGKKYPDPRRAIMENSNQRPYMTPAQFFRQMDVKYPTKVAMNCFILAGDSCGLYFGSHDPLIEDTWHGLRLYRAEDGEFSELECGIYKYPHCFAGETWSCEANVISPYTGTWHVASGIYREWADIWWDKREVPLWIKRMKSWQRIIFKHQYGEYLFRYSDLNGRIKEAGHSVGCNTVMAFGWWKEGMDNAYPNYSPDDSQGGDEGWADAIGRFKEDGDKLVMYYNGKLIDFGSEYFRSGEGRRVCYHDNFGEVLTCHYRFTGKGTWLGEYNARTFGIADTREKSWLDILVAEADRAMKCGANAVFYDQMGYSEAQSTIWDTESREYPYPYLRVAYDKAQAMKLIRDHIAALDPDFGLGTEQLTDYVNQYIDFVHVAPGNTGPYHFQDLYRYTFPEVIFSDREIRDDTDVERRVNLTVLMGLRNDIEIYRCRDLIDKTPVYQEYLARVNGIKERYGKELLEGRYNDVLGFSLGNDKVQARSFVADGTMAIAMTNDLPDSQTLATSVEVPGYEFVEASVTGSGYVGEGGTMVVLGQHDLAVLLYRKAGVAE